MKKVLTLLLTLCMVLSLAACGGKDSGSSAPADSGTSAPADTGSEDSGDSGEAAPSGDTIKIGLYATITGPNALAG